MSQQPKIPMPNHESPKVRVIYLGGPSSSGKSSLAHALQQQLITPFLHIGIDKVIGMMPAKFNDWWGGEAPEGFSWQTSQDEEGRVLRTLHQGAYAKRICDLYHQLVLTIIQQGHCLIVDDVPLSQLEFDAWSTTLSPFDVLKVGVSAPVEILERREAERGDRIIGSARVQWMQSRMDFGYDLVLDTHQLNVTDQVAQIEQLIC